MMDIQKVADIPKMKGSGFVVTVEDKQYRLSTMTKAKQFIALVEGGTDPKVAHRQVAGPKYGRF